MSLKRFLVNARTKILEFKKKHNLLVEKVLEIEEDIPSTADITSIANLAIKAKAFDGDLTYEYLGAGVSGIKYENIPSSGLFRIVSNNVAKGIISITKATINTYVSGFFDNGGDNGQYYFGGKVVTGNDINLISLKLVIPKSWYKHVFTFNDKPVIIISTKSSKYNTVSDIGTDFVTGIPYGICDNGKILNVFSQSSTIISYYDRSTSAIATVSLSYGTSISDTVTEL